jgi:hypothetical protein
MGFSMRSLLLRTKAQSLSTLTLETAKKYAKVRDIIARWHYLNETASVVVYPLSVSPPPHLCVLFILSVSYPCVLRSFCHPPGSSDRAVGAERIGIEKYLHSDLPTLAGLLAVDVQVGERYPLVSNVAAAVLRIEFQRVALRAVST